MNLIQRIFSCRSTEECAKAIAMFLVELLIMILIIRFLWNTSLVKHISVLRPATTLMDTLLLAISLQIIRG